MQRKAVIDADSIVYIVAHNFKENLNLEDTMFVEGKCETFLQSILEKTMSTGYSGAFSSSSYIRTELYKYDLYKGGRPEKPEWLTYWSPVIKKFFIEQKGFIVVPDGYEADDFMYVEYLTSKKEGFIPVFCSPDKDIKQLPGLHYDYKLDKFCQITDYQAGIALYTLMLEGDKGDNIAGIPGMGEVKAAKALASCEDWADMHLVVLNQYLASFGPYYGEIIFDQTFKTVSLQTWNT